MPISQITDLSENVTKYEYATQESPVITTKKKGSFSIGVPREKTYQERQVALIGNMETARYLTEIEYPDKKGIACNVKQHSINLKKYVGAPPYYPNYNLGADSCHGVGIDEVDRDKVRIYPNTASARIHIEGVAHETIIFNTLGQQVLVSKEKEIDVSHLPVGVYHVLLSDRNGAVLMREKLIIQR